MSSRSLSIFSRTVAVVSLLLLAFIMVKEYSGIEVPDKLASGVGMVVPFLAVVLFAFFCNLFTVDIPVRYAGFLLLLGFVPEFCRGAVSFAPAAGSGIIIPVLAVLLMTVSFIFVITGLFKIAFRGAECEKFKTAARFYAGARILYVLLMAGCILVSNYSLDAEVLEKIPRIKVVFGEVVPVAAAAWFYWELGSWITVRWEKLGEVQEND